MYHLYARVSTDEQVAGTSLAEQLRRGRGLAQMDGVEPLDVFEYVDEGVSGSIPLRDRPYGGEMLKSCKPGDTIVASKLDRLFRSALDSLSTLEELTKAGISLVLLDIGNTPVTSNGAAKMFFGILAQVAEFDRTRILERMAEGRKAKRARQGYIGGKVPYGCTVVGRGRAAVLEKAPQTVEIERIVAQMTGDGHKTGRVARYLSKYFPTASGKPWQQVQVDRIVQRLKHG